MRALPAIVAHWRAELRERLLKLLLRRNLGVPGEISLHERDAFAFDGVRDDAHRLTVVCQRSLESTADIGVIVPVALDRVPAKGAELCPWIVDRTRAREAPGERPAELREPVVIENSGQVIQLVAGSREARFPDLAFLNLPIAEHDPSVKRKTLQARAESHADPGR